jgi:hypothetical protein
VVAVSLNVVSLAINDPTTAVLEMYQLHIILRTFGKRYLRVATGIPVVREKCVFCHANYKGNKGNVGALSYTVPVIE